jgi:DNA-binding transcriptional ArsR family regulator
MTAERRTIVVSPHARELRRRLGPTAWAVLEELLSASHGDAGDCHSTATVRSLAADLGLSKDTVARALARLRAAGIVIAEQDRAPAGTFAAGRYRICVPDAIALVQPEPPTPAATRPRAARPTGSQLALTLD